jgi:antitoxin component YwqK of YwqJK toxin-antitoxin module
MKSKLFILIFILSCLFYSCNKTKKDDGFKKICNENYCEEGRLLNHKKVGVWKRYNDSNDLLRIENYHRGVLNGVSVSFYKNGKIYSVGSYKNGELHGNISLFYENGNINSSDNYINGNKDGYSLLFDRNGNLKQKWFYRSGEKDGKQYYFDKKRDTTKIKLFKKGKLIRIVKKLEKDTIQ